MNTCETCRYYMASPLQEPCESCHWDGVIGHNPPNWEGPTNADRIRSMTDEELEEWLVKFVCSSAEPYKSARKAMYKGDLVGWLRKEMKE